MSSSKKKTKRKPNSVTVHQVTEFIEEQPDDIPEEVVKELIARRFESMTYSGPIPHPQLLKEFNDVIPNGADRIMTMAEKQSGHRIILEEKVVNANNRDSFLGVVFAGVIALLIVLGAIFLIYNNKDIQGFSLLIGTSVAYISVFLKSKSRDDKDLKEKE
ncbi:DUF2335 domain-containing protein [Streptococcus suis]|uniref:DUF2335 domain-containing protein n=1 Tax=Streptococcus suivaginalis TaxID=3028082 RepID=A0AA97A079_9STRE|nr:DUF2335 domain-containing protein [Streptococcus sp. 29896]MCK4027398.1 DUF2335 domain-containing protein [Streptococcus suis]WNY47104.1 DUF2335 domain-containing protein [Streptococcus sp. 29896]